MSKPFKVHSFGKSQQTEINSAPIHNEVYERHVQEVNKNHNTEFKVKVDRDICNYETKLGKDYQTADTDALLILDCEKTNKSGIRKISEKTRTKYYDDVYIEVVSVLKWNSQTKKYEAQAPGWGLKHEKLSPDCLSLLFLNTKKKTYYSVFIDKYKKLKTDLFNEAFYNNMENGKIEDWLNKIIDLDPNKGRKGFRHSIEGKNSNNVKEVIFARNKGYITVGFTFPMSYIKSLVHVSEYRGKIVDQNAKTMQY